MYFLFITFFTSDKNYQVLVDSSIASPSQLLPIGTCILTEGVLKQPSVPAKHSIELKVEKILHIGTVDDYKYPLSKKRLPLETLRDCSHFRPRTTTVSCTSIIATTFCFIITLCKFLDP